MAVSLCARLKRWRGAELSRSARACMQGGCSCSDRDSGERSHFVVPGRTLTPSFRGDAKASNPESMDSPMCNCTSEVWSYGPSRNDGIQKGRRARADCTHRLHVSNSRTPTASHSRGAFRPGFANSLPPLKSEGAGNAGRPMRPQAACAEIVAVRTRVGQVTPESSGIPRAMVYGL
jgi:hypothetical protein